MLRLRHHDLFPAGSVMPHSSRSVLRIEKNILFHFWLRYNQTPDWCNLNAPCLAFVAFSGLLSLTLHNTRPCQYFIHTTDANKHNIVSLLHSCLICHSCLMQNSKLIWWASNNCGNIHEGICTLNVRAIWYTTAESWLLLQKVSALRNPLHCCVFWKLFDILLFYFDRCYSYRYAASDVYRYCEFV